MIQFSAILLLYLYLGLAGILIFISLGHIFHAIRFGGLKPTAILTSGMFIAGIVVIAWASSNLLVGVDWSNTFSVDFPSMRFLGPR